MFKFWWKRYWWWFLDESILLISKASVPWYVYYANFIICGLLLEDLSCRHTRKFLFYVKRYVWDEHFLFRECAEFIIHHCVLELQVQEILWSLPCFIGGTSWMYTYNFWGVKKWLLFSYNVWIFPCLFKYYVQCQMQGSTSMSQALLLSQILDIDLFDV